MIAISLTQQETFLYLTALDPLRKERRFRQTGSRISIQLKFRHAAGARAQARKG